MLSRSRQIFFGISALLFAASAAVTIRWSTMPGMAMRGGMPMPGQDWPGAAASFLAMWVAMMAAMMLPSLVPALWRYRQALSGVNQAHAMRLTALAGAGYFFVWLLLGIALFPLGPGLTNLETRWPELAGAAPVAVAAIAMIAGLLQFTPWKVYHLMCCRGQHGAALAAHRGGAWHYGMRLGLHCSLSSAGPTAILLAVGMMDLRAMALVTAA
ncbi:MAG TPA: DUF2182 domain-containing protein, partial [Rhizomicrobium sp.]|nr:DUF2182 domain-containing protein [Rhizomicrobium sp.]